MSNNMSIEEILVENQKLGADLNNKIDFKDTNICIELNDNLISTLSATNEKLLGLYSHQVTKAEFNENIAKALDGLNMHSSIITDNTSSLVEAINVIPNGSYGLAITSGIIGAIVASIAAVLANYFYQNHMNRKNKLAHFANITLKLLSDFEQYAIEYWITEKKNNKRKENNASHMKSLEVRIKSEFFVLKTSLDELKSILPPSGEEHKEKIDSFISKVYDDATGGDFESDNKKSEKKIASQISKQCSSIKATLLKYSQFSI